jgi:hypothetical protein
MKATLKELANSMPAFNRFIAIALPMKTSFMMKGVIRTVSEQVKDFHEERLVLCKRLGTLDEKTETYEFGDNQAAWDVAFEELAAVEVDIPGERLKISQLLSSTAIAPADLIELEWLIDDGTPRPEPVKDDIQPDDESEPVLDLGTEQASTAASGQ